jgi:thioester reductase-like protein
VKPVHFVSTLDVFPTTQANEVKAIREWDSLDCGQALSSNYAQSKWVAEKLLAIARSRGLPVYIYRPGRISGHSQTGFSNPDDLLFRLIMGCIHLGFAPALDTAYDLTPVDYVSRAIVYLSQQKQSPNKTFHIISPQPIQSNQLFDWICSFGYPLQQISYDKWWEKVRELSMHSLSNKLHPLITLFSEREIERQTWNSEFLQFDCQNTLDGLAGTSITCPIVNFELFYTYLSYFIRIGLLDAPKLEAIKR